MVKLKNFGLFDISYPGIEIKVELIVLRAYLEQIGSGVDAICSEYLDKEIKKYEGVPYYEYQHVYRIAEDEMPRIIRNPFVLSIYTLLESSVKRLIAYSQSKENKSLSFNDISGSSLLAKANKYLENILLYDYRFGGQVLEFAANFNAVRNCIAHANGDLDQLELGKRRKLERVIQECSGLCTLNGQLIVEEQYLLQQFDRVDLILEQFMQYLETKHFGTIT